MQVLDLGNNESVSVGVSRLNEGFVAMTLTQSKTFKTEKGAIAWLKKRGYNSDGTRI